MTSTHPLPVAQHVQAVDNHTGSAESQTQVSVWTQWLGRRMSADWSTGPLHVAQLVQAAGSCAASAQSQIGVWSRWLGRTISNECPSWISDSILPILQNIHPGIKPHTFIDEVREQLPAARVVQELVLEYTIPGEIIEAIRNELQNKKEALLDREGVHVALQNKKEALLENQDRPMENCLGGPLSSTLIKMLEESRQYTHLVEELDLHGLRLVHWAEMVWTALPELKALAHYLPNIKRVNCTNCATLFLAPNLLPFPALEVIDISGACALYVGHPEPEYASDVSCLLKAFPKLKKLIATRNRFSDGDKALAKEKYPHLEIIN